MDQVDQRKLGDGSCGSKQKMDMDQVDQKKNGHGLLKLWIIGIWILKLWILDIQLWILEMDQSKNGYGSKYKMDLAVEIVDIGDGSKQVWIWIKWIKRKMDMDYLNYGS